MRIEVLFLAAALAAPLPAAAESMLVHGDARTLGWPTYDGSGHLGFTECSGKSQSLEDAGSFIATEEHCPSQPAPYTLTGKVHAIAPERSRLELTDQTGATHMLYLSKQAAEGLAKLAPDATIEVQGPVAGHAATVRPTS